MLVKKGLQEFPHGNVRAELVGMIKIMNNTHNLTPNSGPDIIETWQAEC